MTGTELAQLLLEKYHIQVEMQTEHYVLALAAVGDSEEGFERLCRAIEEIDQEESQKKRKTEGQIAERVAYTSMNQLMSVTEAMEAESEVCRLEESVGRGIISAGTGGLYQSYHPCNIPEYYEGAAKLISWEKFFILWEKVPVVRTGYIHCWWKIKN